MPGSNNYSQRPEEETTQQVNNPPTVQAPPAKEPVSNYESVYNILQQKIAENPLETPDQRKRRERREKLEGIISSISDAASAVSNLVFTSDYAPDMYSQSNSMSDATQRRFDKAKELRDQRLKNHLNYAMNIGRIKDAERNWRRQLEQDRIAAAQRKHDNDIADAKELRADAIFQLQQDLEKHKINAAEADARRKKIEADYAENYEKARVAREKASAGASNARADYYRGGGSGGKKSEFPWYDEDGKLHYAQSYEAAAYNARANGTWNEEETTSTSERNDGFTTTTTTSTKPGKGYSKRPEKKGKGYGSESGKGKGY